MTRISFLLLLVCLTGLASAAEIKLNDSLALTLPPGWTGSTKDGITTLIAPEKTPHIQIRVLPQHAATVQANVTKLIVDQVKDFSPANVDMVSEGSHPGVCLTGTGVEADDGDPSNAEITILSVPTGTVLVISHGEGTGTADRSKALAGILASLH